MGQLSVYKATENPIFVFSTRRSGSTLLMRMIYSQKKVDYVDQPLDLWKPHPCFEDIPRPTYSQYITLDEHDKKTLREFFDKVISGGIRIRNQWDITDVNFSFRVNRLVVKILNGLPMIDWFSKEFELDIIYQIRHPIPVALSTLKRGWGNVASAYLEDEQFCEEHLDATKVDFGRKVLRQGSRIQQFVLEWCLRNTYTLRRFRKRSWLTLTYEEVVSRPREVSELICHKLDLPNHSRMREVIETPTATTTSSSKQAINDSGSVSLVDRWMHELSPEEVSEAADVLEVFEIEVYSASDPFPHSEVCHFD